MNLLGKPPRGQKAERGRKDPRRLAAVAAMPCVICHEYDCHRSARRRFITASTDGTERTARPTA